MKLRNLGEQSECDRTRLLFVQRTSFKEIPLGKSQSNELKLSFRIPIELVESTVGQFGIQGRDDQYAEL